MPQVSLYPPSPSRSSPHGAPLPQLLQTPAGLAILELQGTINIPPPLPESSQSQASSTLVGRLVFPDYDSNAGEKEGDRKWMKKVYFYVGKHQRLTGEVKELSKPLGVMRRRVRNERGHAEVEGESMDGVESRVSNGRDGGAGGDETDELEIVEVVRWKLCFSSRPEPVGGMGD